MPAEHLAGNAVHLDTDGLTDVDMGNLGFAVIGGDPLAGLADQIRQGLSGSDILTGLQSTPPHVSAIRSRHHGVRKIQIGQIQCRFGPQHIGLHSHLFMSGFIILRMGCLLLFAQRVITGLRRFVSGFHLLILLAGHRLLLQQTLITAVILLGLPELGLGLGQIGILLVNARLRSTDAGSQHLSCPLGIQQSGLRLFLPDEILAVVQNDQGISLMHILMLAEADFLHIPGHPHVYRCDILVHKSVVGNLITDITPKVIGRPGQSGTGNEQTYDIQNDVAALFLFQALISDLNE